MFTTGSAELLKEKLHRWELSAMENMEFPQVSTSVSPSLVKTDPGKLSQGSILETITHSK